MRIAFFTIVTKNYLPFARVLMRSVQRWHPDALRLVILVDEIEGYFDPASEPFVLHLSKDLDIPNSRWFHFKYTPLELCTAAKPWAMHYLLNSHDLEAIVYLDPDVHLYAPINGILESLAGQTMVLTPHLTGRLADSLVPTELDILRSGSYNLGFLALNRGPAGAAFIKWWQEKLYDHCVVDIPRGLFVDQRWMDLVPGMFPGVVIDRTPGNNVAYWNLGHREVRKTAAGFTVGGDNLRFFHFSGFDPLNPDHFSKHQTRFRLSRMGDVRELVHAYAQQLIDAGYAECRTWPYAYGRFENGFPIPDMGRAIHTESEEFMARVSDPFSVAGSKAFVHFWNEPAFGERDNRPGVTRLAYRIYRCRSDVQAVMPDIHGRDYPRFLDWMLSSGKSEHMLPDAFLAPLQDAVRDLSFASVHNRVQRTSPGPRMSKLASIVRDKSPGLMDGLIGGDVARIRLTPLAEEIYESRSDLRRYLPDPGGKDGPKYLVWLLTYGAREYGLSEVYLAPLRSQWQAFVGSLPWMRRVKHRSALLAATAVLSARVRALHLMNAARKLDSERNPGSSGGRPVAMVASKAGARPAAILKDHAAKGSDLPFGVNIIGYLRAEMGVGESCRASLASAKAVGIPSSSTVIAADGQYREAHPFDDDLLSTDYAVNLLHINADQTEIVARRLGDRYYANHYSIGYWAWELEEFPERWQPATSMYGEIWTPSRFCQDAIALRSAVPVIRMPHAIRGAESAAVAREDLGLPREGFLFLSVFDMLSVVERKNPRAAIEAFRAAFCGDPRVHLVLKVNNPQQNPEQLRVLREAAGNSNVVFIDRTVSREVMFAIIRHCDCFVSLHRSEGFGMAIAEAMLMSKPAIVTAYSGNMDFTKPGNSLLVGYNLRPVGGGCEPYGTRCVWAEPSIEEAIGQMKAVFESDCLRHRIGAEARDCISKLFSADEIGRRMRNRLQYIWTAVLGRTAPDSA